MARQEQDREDLLAEATALVRRVELSVEGIGAPVVIGFRRDGCASLYVGGDEAWHFNTRGQLRRAYVEGTLLKAESGALVAMRRQPAAGKVELRRHDLSPEETRAMLGRLSGLLARLREAVGAGGARVLRQVPKGEDLVGEVRRLVESLALRPPIARSPHVK
jgi:hypothetical protein